MNKDTKALREQLTVKYQADLSAIDSIEAMLIPAARIIEPKAKELREQLAAVTKERDELKSHLEAKEQECEALADRYNKDSQTGLVISLTRERDELKAVAEAAHEFELGCHKYLGIRLEFSRERLWLAGRKLYLALEPYRAKRKGN